MKFFHIAAIAAVSLLATAANAVTIDGSYDPEYGLPKSTVAYDPTAPDGNFGSPTPFSNTTAYSIYLTSDANNVYGFLKSATQTGLSFANLYFDIDPQNANGSDLGFEIANDRAFVPGMSGYSGPLGLSVATSADGTGIEFALPNTLFTAPIAGLTYYGGQEFPTTGGAITLRLSQSFGYSVAGGGLYGPNRLGSITIGGDVAAVPEPATWALMLGGFGLLGAALRRRTQSTATPVLA